MPIFGKSFQRKHKGNSSHHNYSFKHYMGKLTILWLIIEQVKEIDMLETHKFKSQNQDNGNWKVLVASFLIDDFHLLQYIPKVTFPYHKLLTSQTYI